MNVLGRRPAVSLPVSVSQPRGHPVSKDVSDVARRLQGPCSRKTCTKKSVNPISLYKKCRTRENQADLRPTTPRVCRGMRRVRGDSISLSVAS